MYKSRSIFDRKRSTYTPANTVHARGEDIFKIIDGFFHDNSISWDKCAGICTDGAAACTGINSGVVKQVKDKAPNVQWTHCFLHKQALVAKSLSEELHDTLNCVIKCVNYIKARPLNQRLFSCLCDEMGADHIGLLLHTEVRWLSRGQVLKRVYELPEEIVTFLNKQNHVSMAEKFTQEKFIANMAYLADIFNSLNSLNQSMQGTGFTVINHAAKITAYYKKLILWQTYVSRDEFSMFAELDKYIAEKRLNVKDSIIEYLDKLSNKMEHYYGDVLAPTNKHHWIIDPFAVTNLPELPLGVAEEFTEMTAEPANQISFNSFKEKHAKISANIFFWVSIHSIYPTVYVYVIQQLIPFVTTWLCEAALSAMSVLKTKHRNRLDVEHDLRLSLSKITPQFQKLVETKQAHSSD